MSFENWSGSGLAGASDDNELAPIPNRLPTPLSSLRPCLILRSPFSIPRNQPLSTSHYISTTAYIFSLLRISSRRRARSDSSQLQSPSSRLQPPSRPTLKRTRKQLHHCHIPRIAALRYRQWRAIHCGRSLLRFLMSSLPRSTTIPPSPTSPPASGLKRRRLSDNIPQSPISPPLMSVATKSYVASYGNPHNTDEVSGRSSPRSPRGSVSRAHQSTSRTTTSLPTPANSVVGIPGLEMTEDIDSHRDKRPRLDADRDEEEDKMEVDTNSLFTNHDRQQDADMADGSDKRTLQPDSLRGRKNETNTLEQQKDMGEPFLLCRSSKTHLPSLPCRVFPFCMLLTKLLCRV